ncbi:MAG: hypothetical protein E6K44_03615 [Gammaproteobacteria bacterium]|nr:MAG: hypothetical protein E6K44_03615 [Gammaproteobacteria bacterium]
MIATSNFSSVRAGAEARHTEAAAASAAPFVLNLCSSTTPMALAQTDLPELKRFTFFVSRRFEEGRERFRLHMGYFATLAEAEEWLGVVREIYPGAWAGEAPGRKLRERATAAAAAQARHATGPQPRVAPAPMRTPAAAPAAARPAAPRPPAGRVPVVHAAPPAARRAAAAPVLAPPVVRPAAPRITSPTAAPRPAAGRAPPPPARTPPPSASAAVPPAARASGRGVKQVFEDSNVREVLAALGEASATGETRVMHAPPAPRAPPPESNSLSDTQVLKMLELRRPDGSEPPPADIAHGSIPMLKPDDTGTRRALKEAVVSNAPVSFAVQLQWSVQPAELDKVPPLAIFSAYTLYTVEGSRDGRKWYGLRLGFFSDAISAKQVAHYVRSEFASVAVVPVSPQEKTRATDQDVKAATLGAPVATRSRAADEFKLIDDDRAGIAVAALLQGKQQAAGNPGVAPSAKATSKVAVGRTVRQPAKGRARAKVGARERRGPHTLEETLEILGASQLTIDNGTGETLNDSGVRHLRVEVQKNSAFTRLLERLSERVKKL